MADRQKITEAGSLSVDPSALLPVASDPAILSVSSSAALRIRELIIQEGNYNLKLRVYITGGGCSGFQYGFAFDEKIKSDDNIIEKEVVTTDEKDLVKIQIVVDALSIMYLEGALIDYVETLQGAHFIVKNPNAQTTCSCGSSFSL